MNKKTIILVSALVAVVLLYVFLNRNIANTLNGNDRNFEFASTEKIDKIFIVNKSSKQHITLTRNEDKTWMVNDVYKANISQVDLILTTLRKMRIKRPVSKNEKNNAVKDLATRGSKVEIYENGKLSKVFYVGGNTSDETGTYFFMENGNEPYVCHIPGMKAYIGARFFTDVVAWRSKSVFANKEEEIRNVSVQWQAQPEKSFVINNDSKEPVLVSGSKTYKNNTEVNLNKIRAYLKLWENLSFEGFPIDLDPHKIDSISKTPPLVTLTLTDKKGQVTTLVIHKKGIKEDSGKQLDREGNQLQFDVESYYAFINGNKKEIVQIQDYIFGKVLKYNSDFSLK
jgi:hypothetical protein